MKTFVDKGCSPAVFWEDKEEEQADYLLQCLLQLHWHQEEVCRSPLLLPLPAEDTQVPTYNTQVEQCPQQHTQSVYMYQPSFGAYPKIWLFTLQDKQNQNIRLSTAHLIL